MTYERLWRSLCSKRSRRRGAGGVACCCFTIIQFDGRIGALLGVLGLMNFAVGCSSSFKLLDRDGLSQFCNSTVQQDVLLGSGSLAKAYIGLAQKAFRDVNFWNTLIARVSWLIYCKAMFMIGSMNIIAL
jgi:hypothetical protein